MSKTKVPKSDASQTIAGFADAMRSHLGTGIIVIDGPGGISACTGAAGRILGLKGLAPAGNQAARLPAALQKIARDTVASAEPALGLEIELGAEGKSSTVVGVDAIPIIEGQRAVGVVLAVTDLSSIRQLEEKLWRLDRLANIGTLAASMAHEIKNALVAGKTFIDLLLEKNPDAELANIVRRETGRIDTIVSRMLKFAGPDRAAYRTISLHETLQHSLRLVQPQREAKMIELEENLKANPDHIQGDDHQLQQAFVNLLLNALEAMGPNGALSVTTRIGAAESSAATPPDSQIHIVIADNGDGIAPESVGRVFEPFFTTKPGGTGLGLPITRRIIEEHRGMITVSSQLKKGTAFTIVLPAGGSEGAGC